MEETEVGESVVDMKEMEEQKDQINFFYSSPVRTRPSYKG